MAGQKEVRQKFQLKVLKHHFGITRIKSRHHQIPEMTWFWHLWNIIMPTFGSHDAKKYA